MMDFVMESGSQSQACSSMRARILVIKWPLVTVLLCESVLRLSLLYYFCLCYVKYSSLPLYTASLIWKSHPNWTIFPTWTSVPKCDLLSYFRRLIQPDWESALRALSHTVVHNLTIIQQIWILTIILTLQGARKLSLMFHYFWIIVGSRIEKML